MGPVPNPSAAAGDATRPPAQAARRRRRCRRAGRAKSADEQAVGAEARIAQIEAYPRQEDERLLDDDEQDEPRSRGDVGNDENQDDELGSPGEWGTPT